jgi:transcriptional regulator with XRE-family HTH domain
MEAMDEAARAEAFGELLREFRLRIDMTQAMLADRSGCSTRGIQHLECGGSQPQRETVLRLVDALRLSRQEAERFETAALPRPRRRREASSPPAAQAPTDSSYPDGTVTLVYVELGHHANVWGRSPEIDARTTDDRCQAIVRAYMERYGGAVLSGHEHTRVSVAAFARTSGAMLATIRLQQALSADSELWRASSAMRIAVQTGEANVSDGEYGGGAFEDGDALLAMVERGQILLSEATAVLGRDVVNEEPGFEVRLHDPFGLRVARARNRDRVFELVSVRVVETGIDRRSVDVNRRSSRQIAPQLLALRRMADGA